MDHRMVQSISESGRRPHQASPSEEVEPDPQPQREHDPPAGPVPQHRVDYITERSERLPTGHPQQLRGEHRTQHHGEPGGDHAVGSHRVTSQRPAASQSA